MGALALVVALVVAVTVKNHVVAVVAAVKIVVMRVAHKEAAGVEVAVETALLVKIVPLLVEPQTIAVVVVKVQVVVVDGGQQSRSRVNHSYHHLHKLEQQITFSCEDKPNKYFNELR